MVKFPIYYHFTRKKIVFIHVKYAHAHRSIKNEGVIGKLLHISTKRINGNLTCISINDHKPYLNTFCKGYG